MALFNNLVLPLWICYWLRFQESYENVISSLTTSRATCPAPSGNVIISRSSSTLSLTSQITILILSVVLLFLLPPSRTLHTAALWSSVWLQKGAVKKKKRGKQKTIQGKQIKAERKRLNYTWFCCIMDFMARVQYHVSLEIWGLLYLFTARLVCTIKPKMCPFRRAVECGFKNVQWTQALLLLALEKCPFECSCCWSWARLSA